MGLSHGTPQVTVTLQQLSSLLSLTFNDMLMQ